ncbi:MAG: TonB-dependent receptor [Bacteroidales bacterium]|nr:TonB-dependent receptor [Bacteroidales bacterium]MCF8389270.1 TonB-dependent receptor [Bacteroidales bacterium]
MMRSILTLFLVLIFLNASAQDNSVFIYGRVFDAENKTPLVGANIIYGRNQGSISDTKGNYSINLSPSLLNLTFQYVGYVSEVKHLNLNSGDTIQLNIGLIPAVNEIDQIVISANKVEQKLSDLTVSMTLIKAYSPGNNHISDPQELIAKTPGIEVLDGQASIRGGSGFSYGAGSRVMALIDGLPVIAADAGNIKWQFLPLENLSQIEIIKGASSVLYGSSALNGVINFRTAEAGIEPRTKFFVESGFFDQPSNKDWKWWDTPRVFTNASLSHLQKFGNTDLGIAATFAFDNGYRKLNDEKLGRFSLRLSHKSEKLEGLKYGLNLNSGMTQKIDFVLWENAITGALKHSESTATKLNGTFYAIDPFISFRRNKNTNHDLRMRLQATSNRFPDDEQTNSDAITYYTEYQLQHKLSHFATMNIGFSENYSEVLSNFYGDHQTLNLAGFSQFDMEVKKNVKLVAGVRLEQNIQDGNPDELVPIFRTGINYKLAGYTFLRASFGQGYRYPSIAEKFASTRLGTVKIYPNPDIQPESGWNSEIGIKQGLMIGSLNGMIDLAAFYSQNKNMIEYVFGQYYDPVSDSYDLGFQAWNSENSRVYGTEFEFQLNQSIGMFTNSFRGGYMFMYPVEYKKDDSETEFLKYRRKHSANLEWIIRLGKFDMGLNLYAKSKIMKIDKVFLGELTREDIMPGFYDYWLVNNKGYFLSDLVLGFRKSEQWKVSLAVKNLFNTEYMGRPGDVLPHRNISLRLSGIF